MGTGHPQEGMGERLISLPGRSYFPSTGKQG
jgi:hypothetical protein